MNGVAVPVIMTVTVNFTLRAAVRVRIRPASDGRSVDLGVRNGGIGTIATSGRSTLTALLSRCLWTIDLCGTKMVKVTHLRGG